MGSSKCANFCFFFFCSFLRQELTHYVDQAGLELTEIHLPLRAGVKGVSHHTWADFNLKINESPWIIGELKKGVWSAYTLSSESGVEGK